MQGSDTSQSESSARNRAWSNPYRFRLWFSNQNSDMFTERHKQMVYHFLGWGPKGCDSWNYKLELEFHCSKSTLQRCLRHLEKHALIDIRGALGKHRRIIAIPYPNQAAWMRAAVQETIRKLGARLSDHSKNRGVKFDHHQRRTSKTSINQHADELLYGESFLRLSGGGSPEAFASDIQYDEAQIWEQTRRKIIDQLVRGGQSRDSAITQANIVIKISIRQKGKYVKKP